MIHEKHPYFLILHSLFLLVVLMGFAPSFYLRPLGEHPSLPFYLVVHGLACTTWFVLAFVQPVWIRTHQLARHKQFGTIGMFVGGAVLLTGFWMMYHRIGKYFLLSSGSGQEIPGFDSVEQYASMESMLIWGDILVLLSFLVLIYLGYQNRYRIPFHKRYMLFASVMIIPQAFVRLGKMSLLQIGEDPAASGSLYAVAGPVLILLSLLVYDWVQLKKVHRATLIIWVWYIALLLSAFVIMRTGIGKVMLEILSAP